MRIVRNIALVLILIFVLSSLKVSSFTCYAQSAEGKKETETKQYCQEEKDYLMELAERRPWEALMLLYHNYAYLDKKDHAFTQKIIETIVKDDPRAVLQ